MILRLVTAHIRGPLPERFIVEEDEYIIIAGKLLCLPYVQRRGLMLAARRPWVYGKKKILLTWGGERILPCDDKWRFTLDIRTVGSI